VSGKNSKQLRRTAKKIIKDTRMGTLEEFCEFTNAQKFTRRLKFAFLIIGGKISPEKMNKI
jgi:hypothetical protein